MWKLLVAGTAASVIAGSNLVFAQQPPAPTATVLTGEEGDHHRQPSAEDDQDYGEGPSAEDDQDNGPNWQPSADDMGAFMDARIAALKAGLRLTPDQDKNWPAFESAVRDMAKTRADRWAMRRNEQPAADPVARLQRRAEALGAAAAGLKKLADAEGPLYKSLDEAQKRRFELLAQALRPHPHGCGTGWRR